MPDIRVVPLGAGQDVGRSCILVSIGNKNVMFDCGMHMGYNDERRFPDFNYITGGTGTLTPHIDAVIISHFHLDHCGALPYMSEQVGYEGPIYMTMPTKIIAPILLEDFRKVVTKRDKAEALTFFTSEMIKDCMKKVRICGLHQEIKIDSELSLKVYYAGHVLGAGMFRVTVGDESVLYTGDYNMTPDRHLGAAWADRCKPTLLISESTYATTIRDSKRCRERDFLKKIHSTVENGGKVLIPVFALGRAQELCILLESYWDRMKLNVPVYFTAGLAEKATNYYKLFVNWTNEKIKETFVERNAFDFKYIKAYQKEFAESKGPMVVFATPGMLHAGQSLEIFKKWCTDEKNCIIMPGYCVAGTVGHRILHGERRIQINNRVVDIKIKVEYMSFSAHADAKGIMQLVRMVQPKNLMFVHGEAAKMEFLAKKVQKDIGIACFTPANGETVTIGCPPRVRVNCSTELVRKAMKGATNNEAVVHGAIVANGKRLQLVESSDVLEQQQHIKRHKVCLVSHIPIPSGTTFEKTEAIFLILKTLIVNFIPESISDYRIEKVKESVIITNDMLTIELKAAQNKKQRLIECKWPLELDSEANELIKWIKKDFLNNALQAR